MKKYTFADGTIQYGKLSRDELAYEERKHGKVVKIEKI